MARVWLHPYGIERDYTNALVKATRQFNKEIDSSYGDIRFDGWQDDMAAILAYLRNAGFAAAKHLVKLKTLLDKGLASGGDANAIQLLAGIDEKTLEEVIIPILRDSSVISVSDEKKIDSPNAINLVFTVDTLFDFFELCWEVMKLNFTPFFTKVLTLFGLSPEELASRVQALTKGASQVS
ncbi:phage tail assembly chaperone [Hafnia paralvei]